MTETRMNNIIFLLPNGQQDVFTTTQEYYERALQAGVKHLDICDRIEVYASQVGHHVTIFKGKRKLYYHDIPYIGEN